MARRPDPNARQSLIEAARIEFAKRGLHAARIEDITAACKVSKGSFYLHFPSKESLFAELVAQFQATMDGLASSRRALGAQLLAEGSLTRRDVARASARYRKFRAMEEEEDLRALEAMWSYRDVIEVLISGAQGTPFEGMMWKQVELEASRVAVEFSAQQGQGVCRKDVPAEIFGAMIVGTYLLLAHRMVGMREKPDLRVWARSIQNMVATGANEGPAANPVGAAPAKTIAAKSSRARPHASHARRFSPRSSP